MDWDPCEALQCSDNKKWVVNCPFRIQGQCTHVRVCQSRAIPAMLSHEEGKERVILVRGLSISDLLWITVKVFHSGNRLYGGLRHKELRLYTKYTCTVRLRPSQIWTYYAKVKLFTSCMINESGGQWMDMIKYRSQGSILSFAPFASSIRSAL